VKNFIARHAARITSVLSGFDRLVFRGTLLPLMANGGMFHFLTRAGVRDVRVTYEESLANSR
jgi:hypothetical protein